MLSKVLDYSNQENQTTQSTIAATTEAKHHNTTEKYTVDNYIGLSLEAAREAIDNKFKINVTEEYSDTYAKGLVMQQDPESDTELEEGKTIKLVVSKGQKIEDKFQYLMCEVRRSLVHRVN